MTRRTPARDALLDAAEQLIAERGMAGASVREVQVRAGQSNKTAVQYHFGSRDGLVSAVIEARMGPVNARRRALLADTPDDTEALVRAFVEPLATETLGRSDSHYARFLLQAMVDPTLGEQVLKHLDADSFREVYERLLTISPHPADVAQLRARHVVNLTAVTLASWEGRTTHSTEVRFVTDDLITSCVAILTAATSTS